MDIAAIDKNLRVDTNLSESDIFWQDAACPPFAVYGAVATSPWLRLPLDVAEATSPGVVVLGRNTAGIRVRFRTDSPYIAIHAEWDTLCQMSHMPATGIYGFDLYAVKHGRQRYIATLTPPSNKNDTIGAPNGYDSLRYVSGEMTDYVLNFPLYNNVDRLLIGVKEGSSFETPASYSAPLPIVYYGSSITQGGCASRPGNCYQNFISRELDMDYINLGFSGSGKAEQPMVDYLASLTMSAFVADYDHNATSPEHLNDTHFNLYQCIRAKHPTIPYIMISRPDFVYTAEGNARRDVILTSYHKALEAGDKNVYFIDGASFFVGSEWDACTVDGAHPNDLGFYRMAQGILPVLQQAL